MNLTNKILLLVFLILAGLVWIVEKPFSADSYELTQSQAGPLFPDFNGNDAAVLEITRGGGETARLVKKERDWLVTTYFDYQAKAGNVRNLLAKIVHFNNTDLIDQNFSETDDRYNVGPKKGTRVTVKNAADQVLVDFYQGKMDGDFSDPDFVRQIRRLPAYLRKEGSRDVYLVTEFPPVIATSRDWVDTVLTGFRVEEVEAIDLGGSFFGQKVSLKKSGDDWALTAPEEAPAAKAVIEAMTRSFSSLLFKELVGPLEKPEDSGLSDPLLTVSMTLKNGSSHLIHFGNKVDETSYFATKPVQGGEAPFLFKVHSYSVDDMLKPLEELKEKPPEEPPAEVEKNSGSEEAPDELPD